MTPWLTVIGVGDGGLETLTNEQWTALGAAKTVFGGARHLAMLGGGGAQELVAWRSPFDSAVADLLDRRGDRVVVLATGDPMWFGVGGTLARHLGPAEMRILPGASAFSLAAARLGWPVESCACVTVHGRPVALIDRHLHPGARLLIYSRDGQSPREIARRLTGRGYGPSRMAVMEHLGGEAERVRETAASGFDLAAVADLNTVAVECAAGRAAIPRSLAPGLPDDSYRGDGQVTKRVPRALALAALEPMPGALLWDVGAGSGSVAVEWVRAAPGTRALAIERRADRRALVSENADELGAVEVEVVVGEAPAVFAGLPAPDAVFIGGGLGNGVLDPAWNALKTGGRIVAHAVTLESEAILLDAYRRFGGEIMRVSVETAAPVGPFHGWRPAMPVLHWHATKPEGGR